MNETSDAETDEVCLLDDDLSVLKSMHYLLASEGFKVRPFNKAEDFLAHASTHDVPVLVTDIWMGCRNRLGSARAALCDLAEDSRHWRHRARRSGRTGHRRGHWAGRIFPETVRRRKVSDHSSRCTGSSQGFLKLHAGVLLLTATTPVAHRTIWWGL